MKLRKSSDTTITKELIQRLDAMDDAVEPTPYEPHRKEYLSNEEIFSDAEYNADKKDTILGQESNASEISEAVVVFIVIAVVIAVVGFVIYMLQNVLK